MDELLATYRLPGRPQDVEPIARGIALEQTVEVPPALAEGHRGARELVGVVRSIVPRSAEDHASDNPAAQNREWSGPTCDVTIAYRTELAGDSAAQLINLLYGNISLKSNILLTNVVLPHSVLAQFPGPKWGLDGIRAQLGVYGRPLLATALKPRGASASELAQLAGAFAAGGGDVVKDDHNLVEVSRTEFEQRVLRCQEAVEEASARRSSRCLYFPNLSARPAEARRRAEWLADQQLPGVLVAPFLLGLDVVADLARELPLALLAHPTFSGAYLQHPQHGIAAGWLLGTLMRLIGCDGTIFPNFGGRFSLSQDDCTAIAQRATEPLGALRGCWPLPAGGMNFDAIPALAHTYGPDCMLLIGGALLGDSADLTASTTRYRERMQELFPAHSTHRPTPWQPTLEKPAATDFVSACELPASHEPSPNGQLSRGAMAAALREWLPFEPGYRWAGRTPEVYKTQAALPFAGVARTELIGRHGEETAFDLRYFELEPGGYSSRERHDHTHVIIAARGSGSLQSGDQQWVLNPLDVAYVPPQRVHQLKNESLEPFGFFCIVDHTRDRPSAP